MTTKPFLDMIVAMDENNAIAQDNKIPWAPLPTDHHWYLTHATATKDPTKRVGLLMGRLTFDDAIRFDKKYVSRWHFIVITRQSAEEFFQSNPNVDRQQIDVVSSFDEGVELCKRLLTEENPKIESAAVFGGADPYNRALKGNHIRRLYLTRVFAKFPDAQTRVTDLDLNEFNRIRRPADELLAELDDAIIEENGYKYQFQVYESK